MKIFALISFAVVVALESWAADVADMCDHYAHYYELEHAIPHKLLHSIALVESGRLDPLTNRHKPWPWTINVSGKGYRFTSKREAIQAVQKWQSLGYRSIDVGCMQVNLAQHPNAFNSIEQAFEPRHNVRYASQFLLAHYKRTGDWRQAVAAYHSQTPMLGTAYAKRVLTLWRQKPQRFGDNEIQFASKHKKYISLKDMRQKQAHERSQNRLRSNMIIHMRHNNEPNDKPLNKREAEAVKAITNNLLHDQSN